MNYGKIVTGETRQQVMLHDKERVVVQVSNTAGFKQCISMYIADEGVQCMHFDESGNGTEIFKAMLSDGYASIGVNEEWNA